MEKGFWAGIKDNGGQISAIFPLRGLFLPNGTKFVWAEPKNHMNRSLVARLAGMATLLTLSLGLSAQPGMEQYFWKQLSKMTLKADYNKASGEVLYAPVYSREVRALAGKEIILKGYVMPVPSREGTFILSAYPFSSCYYCGQAGPETVIEVHPKVPIVNRTNKAVVLKGKLQLNEPYDALVLPYMLMEAEPHFDD
jgi:hypothetical protein